MTQDRASFLQKHIRARMAAIADGLVQPVDPGSRAGTSRPGYFWPVRPVGRAVTGP